MSSSKTDHSPVSISVEPADSPIAIVKTLVYLGLLVLTVLFSLLKLWFTPISLQEIKVGDLLTVVLAIFSIWLSVSFFHRATEQSNQFYNNTYKFTKDITSLLSKIEGECRQRLEHLDVSYTRISDRLPADAYKTQHAIETAIEQQKTVVDVAEGAREQTLNEIASKLTEDREALLASIREKDQALEKAREDLNDLQRRAAIRDHRITPARRVTRYIAHGAGNMMDISDVLHRSESEIEARLRNAPDAFLRDLKALRILGPNGELTHDGLVRFRKLLVKTESQFPTDEPHDEDEPPF